MKNIIRNFFLLLFLTTSFLEAGEFRVLDLVEKKRDQQELSKEEITFFVDEYTKGHVPDYQASAFLMAVYINGMNWDETAYLTDAMIHSGTIVNFEYMCQPIVDKHSTGGVGDKTSLILAPICASLGVKVPMISGRGLGFTGGTLDKLESIPGYEVNQSLENYKKLVEEVGVCIVGQSADIAPADKKIYALRDVSATVECKALIASSILSKKMAEGLDTLVMDVKTGKGAMIKRYEDSLELAQIMTAIGKRLGKNVIAFITDMNQPLGMNVGNALEIRETVDILNGKCSVQQTDLRDLSFTLASHMLIAAGKAEDEKDAFVKIYEVIENGLAYLKFKEMVVAQGGDSNALDDFSYLPTADFKFCLKATQAGFVNHLDALKIARGCSILGGGRSTIDSKIDYSVGTVIYKKIGDRVDVGDVLLEIHYNSEEKLKEVISFFEEAYVIGDEVSKPIVIKKILK